MIDGAKIHPFLVPSPQKKVLAISYRNFFFRVKKMMTKKIPRHTVLPGQTHDETQILCIVFQRTTGWSNQLFLGKWVLSCNSANGLQLIPLTLFAKPTDLVGG